MPNNIKILRKRIDEARNKQGLPATHKACCQNPIRGKHRLNCPRNPNRAK